MHRWFLMVAIGLIVTGVAPRGVNAEQAGKQPAAKGPNPALGFDKSAYEEGEGGILYGKGWAFLISAPKGWVMDDQGNGGQVNVAFYRRGESFAQGEATMYGVVVGKVKGEDDTLDKVIRSDIQQTKEHDPGMKAQRGEPIEIGEGQEGAERVNLETTKPADSQRVRAARNRRQGSVRQPSRKPHPSSNPPQMAVVYTFSGPGTGRSDERVAYIDTHRFVVTLALTARSEKAYKTALPDFSRLVHSFGFLNKTESTQEPKARGAKQGDKSR
jgi:hypothetical protein